MREQGRLRERRRAIYVVFELGARWFSRRTFIPLLAPGVTEVPSPLGRFNGLLLGSRGGVQQLISELARHLGLTAAQPEEYEYHLARVVEAPPTDASKGATRSEPDLPPGALDLLVVIRDGENISWDEMVERGERTPQMTRFHLDALREARLVGATGGGVYNYLSPKGRRFLFDRGLLE